MTVRIVLSLLIMMCGSWMLYAQTNPDVLNIPILPVPKKAEAGERAIVIITWEGTTDAWLKIGDIETVLKAGEQVGAKLLANKPLKVNVVTATNKKYTASQSLKIGVEMAFIDIGVTDDKLYVRYETFAERDLKKKKEEEARLAAKLEEDRKKATLKNILDSIHLNMVLVEGGTFLMGCKLEDESCYPRDAAPQHKVTLSNFYISKYEVTREQWRWIMGEDTKSRYNEISCDDKCPVEYITWDEAQEFIRKLNALTGKNYRLPTEAEWEFAARGGNKSKGYLYSGSNNLDEIAWYEKNHGRRVNPVGKKLPNELGLYDMSGNVAELCSDGSCSYDKAPKINPKGCESDYKVVRGGNMVVNSDMLKVFSRTFQSNTWREELTGFRLAHGE